VDEVKLLRSGRPASPLAKDPLELGEGGVDAGAEAGAAEGAAAAALEPFEDP
jgi:hypothetical protein